MINNHPLPQVVSFCSSCQKDHILNSDACKEAAFSLMDRLEKLQHINLQTDICNDPLLSTDHLFGDARGKMFGVLVGRTHEGAKAILHAFSGQYNGQWIVPGWAPPLFDPEQWQDINQPAEKQIKKLNRSLQQAAHGSEEYQLLKKESKHKSQQLMKRLHDLYTLKNFRDQRASLSQFFKHQRGIPTGAGDCCAPKLLNQAVEEQIRPEGLVEFYWGLENRSKSKHHARFYSPCQEKCSPLLGFLLCGSNNLHQMDLKER